MSRTFSSDASPVTAARSRMGTTRPEAAAMASSLPSSPGDSTVITWIPMSTASWSSASRLPGPVMTTRPGAKPARSTVLSSPALATSAPRPSSAMWLTIASAGFDFTAYARSNAAGRTARSDDTWRSITSRS